jgi:hypothetical protein
MRPQSEPGPKNAGTPTRRAESPPGVRAEPRAIHSVMAATSAQFGVTNRVLNVAVTKVRLQSARVMAGIGQGEAARVPQHVGMGLEGEAGCLAGTLDQFGKAGSRKRCGALAREHERRWRALAPPALAIQHCHGYVSDTP